ncbi:MAG: class I SAM-dependent methyltransferase [Burkholderiales bacterium]|nr:class I SAM-dependent methyltransferase [Burkholderiales bacterium]
MAGPDPQRALTRYREHAAGYEASALRTLPLRYRAIWNLELKPGDAVLDVACGTGMSFPLLAEAIGPAGHLVGVELSPEMAAIARARIDRAGWRNAELIVARMEDAKLPPNAFDAVALNFTHDVLQSEAALANIFAACKPGARIAVAGSKLLPWYLAPINLYVRWNNAPYLTTQRNLARPWRLLERYVPDLQRTGALWGACYLAKGVFRGYDRER